MSESFYHQFLASFQRVVAATEFTDLKGNRLDPARALEQLTDLSRSAQRTKGRQFFVGNGASAAFTSHMSLDWAKNGKVCSLATNDAVWQTALANDLGAEEVFAAFLGLQHAHPGDILITISSSGNSPNILKALATARTLGMTIVTFSGLRADNRSRALGDLNIYTPAKTYGMVECAHQVLLHAWLDHFMGVTEWDRADCQNMKASEFRL